MSDAPDSSLRQRASPLSSNAIADNLPPPRTSKPMRQVSAPLTSTRLSRLIYLLALLTSLLLLYYSYRVVQWKTEVGGWWNLALGRHPPQLQNQYTPDSRKASKGKRGKGDDGSVEDRINALAQALGMPSKELASAIAVAVREYVPPASLSSVAAKETGPAVEAMLKGAGDEHVKAEGGNSEKQGSGVVGSVVSGMESFVGMEEP
ncbi:hypothetical protein Hypma_014363 [Hypsizygus marmoreus]|uniref:Uncharacterized protein n=1 Tax=Hypsizygus marmoreus TaxID=39966 RepID=A0A369JJP6_HYPMA|nr:hypothetical protein Hypma_014363 [Hypsizygus marmoreus]